MNNQKPNTMKTRLSLITTLLLTVVTFAQDLTFSFANARNTNDGTDDFYEADIFIASSPNVRLGTGVIFFNYNTEAFGENVIKEGAPDNFEFFRAEGSLLNEAFGVDFFGNPNFAYGNLVTNNNNSSRVAAAFQPNFSRGAYAGIEITDTPRFLFSIRFKYEDVTKAPNVTFGNPDDPRFDGIQLTPCGPDTPGAPECTSPENQQQQIIGTETFDSSGATPSNSALSVSEFQSVNNIVIFNDANTLQVSSGNTVQLQKYTIYSLSGAPVAVGTGTEADIASLSSGLYIAQLDFDKGTLIKKFVK